uniref:Ig-like domain-containing protein n=1 Tax=Gouania willdenowi TaxID=441366 RepID=A0A8C5DEL3_GOUWI
MEVTNFFSSKKETVTEWNKFSFLYIKHMVILNSTYQSIIPVKPGHDVTLPCEVPDGGTVAVVEWIRTDLKDGYVLLYRNKQLDPDYQHQSYRDRVDLQIKNRNISLILKNVSADDEGTYECRCRFFQRNSPHQQRSSCYYRIPR